MAQWQDGMGTETNPEGISTRDIRSQEYREGPKKYMEIHCNHSLSHFGISGSIVLSLEESSRCTMSVRSQSGKEPS